MIGPDTPTSLARVAVVDPAGAAGLVRGAEPGRQYESGRPIRLLVFTSLYPNAEQPRHGIFVEERLRKLIATGRISATVVAPVPWFPFRSRQLGAYAAFARVPAREERHGMRILHPRYPVIPKVGMNLAPALMYHAVLPTVRRLIASDAIDLIDAHYFYPDGVVAAKLGETLCKSVVVTARGSDINLIARYRGPRRRMVSATSRVASMITVSEALRRRLMALGVEGSRIRVLRNGVDLDAFRPLAPGRRTELRSPLSANGPLWLAVGNLVPLKGVDITLEALALVPSAILAVAGGGPEEGRLKELAHRLDVAERVHFLGPVPHGALCDYYNAADVTVLASSREGMPNVVLESLACGTPVLLAPFESANEIVGAPEAGEIADARTASALAAGWRRLRARSLARTDTRRYAERFGWESVTTRQCELYASVCGCQVRGDAR